MRIAVTAADIRDGRRGKCRLCPVALALRRATGCDWKVSNDGAQNSDGGRIRFGWRVIVWIADFDRGRRVVPFAFNVGV